MDLKTKKWFFFILLVISSISFGYRSSLLFNKEINPTVYDYAIVITFLLVCVMSTFEWFSIRKKLGEFN